MKERRLQRSVQLVALAALLLVGCGAQELTCTVANVGYPIDPVTGKLLAEIPDMWVIKVDDRSVAFEFKLRDLPTDHDFADPVRESLGIGAQVICKETDEGVGWVLVGPAD